MHARLKVSFKYEFVIVSVNFSEPCDQA